METLSSSILEIRNSFLEKFKDEKLEMISKKLDQLFDVEKDPVKRIMLLASRVETIRKRIEQISDDENKTLKIVENSNVEDKNQITNSNRGYCMDNAGNLKYFRLHAGLRGSARWRKSFLV